MKPKILAFYLPQYYPFPENDEWWGKGFTEWTNVGRAKPLFKGHYQPKVPADLGYYDLRLPVVREQQAALAKEYGVDGFCYWHYWFGNGKRLLDLVENEVVESGNPDFPFCFCWANHQWGAKNWNSKDAKIAQRVLMKQEYPGVEDYKEHFQCCLKAFKDPRYIKIDGKPLFGLFDASSFNEVKTFIEIWQQLAKENGLSGIYFVCYCMNIDIYKDVKELPFDEFVVDTLSLGAKRQSKWRLSIRKMLSFLNMDRLTTLRVCEYKDYIKAALVFYANNPKATICALPNYDHSPRSGRQAFILNNATPQSFKNFMKGIRDILNKRETNNRLLFIKSWNEWGEGNYLEPDLKYRRGFLEAIRDVF